MRLFKVRSPFDPHSDPDLPFARWDGDRVSLWLHNLGLSMYVGECRRWVRNGEQLIKASNSDLEKEMGMRNALHRKKLTLALQAVSTGTNTEAARLDHNWVTREYFMPLLFSSILPSCPLPHSFSISHFFSLSHSFSISLNISLSLSLSPPFTASYLYNLSIFCTTVCNIALFCL